MIDQHASLAEKFLKKGFWLYFFSFILAPTGYIIKIIVSGELTVSEVGILYGIISLIMILSTYNDLGMSESLKHFIPKFVTENRYDKVKSILFYAFFMQLISSVIIALFFFFGADYIAENYFKTSAAAESLKVFAFFFIGLNIFQTIGNFFMAVQDTFYSKLADVLRMLFVMLFVLYIAFFDISNLLNYSYAWLIGLYTGTIISLGFLYKKYYIPYFKTEKILFEKKLFIQILKYASLVFIGTSSAMILGQMDMQMIIFMLGTKDAGYYTNYLSIIGITYMIIGPIFALLFPIFSELHAKNDIAKIRLIKQLFQSIFLIISLMFNVFMFIFAQTIAFSLFGEKFITSGIILQYSILLLVFNSLLQINFNLMAGVGKVKERVKIMLIAIVFNFFLNLLFIKILGVYGPALATGIGWVIIFILSEFFIGKEYRSPLDYKLISKNILFIGTLGIFFHYYVTPFFIGLNRISSFFMLFVFFIIWFFIFIGINYNSGKMFIGEIRKLKKSNT